MLRLPSARGPNSMRPCIQATILLSFNWATAVSMSSSLVTHVSESQAAVFQHLLDFCGGISGAEAERFQARRAPRVRRRRAMPRAPRRWRFRHYRRPAARRRSSYPDSFSSAETSSAFRPMPQPDKGCRRSPAIRTTAASTAFWIPAAQMAGAEFPEWARHPSGRAAREFRAESAVPIGVPSKRTNGRCAGPASERTASRETGRDSGCRRPPTATGPCARLRWRGSPATPSPCRIDRPANREYCSLSSVMRAPRACQRDPQRKSAPRSSVSTVASSKGDG